MPGFAWPCIPPAVPGSGIADTPGLKGGRGDAVLAVGSPDQVLICGIAAGIAASASPFGCGPGLSGTRKLRNSVRRIPAMVDEISRARRIAGGSSRF
jgi:hypothetical protein